MIKPIYTEKSLKLAKTGKFSFMVDKNSTKSAIKSEIAKLFNVHVTGIKTITVQGEKGKNARGTHFAVRPLKKAIVSLKEKEKIDLFEESKSQ